MHDNGGTSHEPGTQAHSIPTHVTLHLAHLGLYGLFLWPVEKEQITTNTIDSSVQFISTELILLKTSTVLSLTQDWLWNKMNKRNNLCIHSFSVLLSCRVVKYLKCTI